MPQRKVSHEVATHSFMPERLFSDRFEANTANSVSCLCDVTSLSAMIPIQCKYNFRDFMMRFSAYFHVRLVPACFSKVA